LLRELFPGSSVRAEPDYTAAFYASPPLTDICVIAGTGSTVCSRARHGVIKSGGRGYILGDFGSAFHYGRDALLHFLDNPDGSSPALRHAVREVFGTDDEADVVSSVYKSGTAPQTLAKLARVLGAEASAGEPYAIASLDCNTRALTIVVREHVYRYLKPSNLLRICLAGGLWKGAPIFKTRFRELLEEQLPEHDVTVTPITRPPVYGALELAKELQVVN
jgi:N-acetylglucosamine kinase-like BadF-type ATPase